MIFALGNESANLSIVKASKNLDSHESASGLTVVNGTMKPSISFLNRVAEYLRSIGLVDATPSVAWQFWYFVGHYEQLAKNENSELARIAYWYKIDPFELGEFEQVGLLANLDRMQCQDRIHRGDYNPMDYNGVYNLFKAAFDDEDLARKKQTESFKLFVEKCTKQKR